MQLPIFNPSRRALLICAGLSLWGIATAAPVSPEDARSEALDFLTTTVDSERRNLPASNALSLAFTATENDLNCFYIFNDTSGFVIVSADDRLPAILGYSDNGNFDPQHTPENFKWWLGQYRAEIASWIPTAPEEAMKRPKRSTANRQEIAPMTTTKWNQDAPYNNDCPLYQGGYRTVTGCVATAMAQLMKYHEWPKQPTGSNAGITFSGTTYDWKNMLDVYEQGKYTSAQAQAVATLMRQCGAAVNMQYSPWASGAYDMDVQMAFTNYFGYDNNLKMVWRDYTPLTRWTNMVYEELAAGRPLYYSGSSNEGGHAFVCDGYSRNDFFHFNWGWGGYQDGYFLLTALNPASGGAGSYEGGYNSGQIILTGLKPGPEASSKPQQTALISTGGFFYGSNDTFEIRQSNVGVNIIYNPLGYVQNLSIGLKYENKENPDATPSYINCGTESIQPGYGLSSISASAPKLEDGVYKVTPVYAVGNSADWQPVAIPLGKQNFVQLTVKGSSKEYANVGPDDSYRPRLIINEPESTPVIYGNADIVFRVPVLNVGKGDYAGNLSVTLMDKNDDYGDAVSIYNNISVGAGSFLNWQGVTDQEMAPGEYLMYVIGEESTTYLEGVTVRIEKGDFPAIKELDKIRISDLAPNFIVSEQDNPIYFSVKSTSIYDEKVKFHFVLLDGETLKKISGVSGEFNLNLPANYEGRVTIPPHDLGVMPGKYYWYIADEEDNPLCKPTPLIVDSPVKKSGSIEYLVLDETHKIAQVIAPEGEPYKWTINVPEKINGYTVTSLRPDAFAFSTVGEVTLPSTISSIPDGGFYGDTYLRVLTLNSPTPINVTDQTFNSRTVPYSWLIVPDALVYDYRSMPVWIDFRMTHWNLQLTDVEITSGMKIDPATGEPYAPYYVNCFTPLELTLSAPVGMNVDILVNVNGENLQNCTIDPTTTKVNLPEIGVKGYATFRATATNKPVSIEEILSDETPQDVFTVDGRLVIRQATPENVRSLTPGLYIIGSRKIIIK